MKKALLLLVSVLMLAATLAAQDNKSTITVKNSQVSNGVVVINVALAASDQQAKTSWTLHCNKDASSCVTPQPGSYVMVRLPKNWGMYDCEDVDLYANNADPETAQKVGEYCIVEK